MEQTVEFINLTPETLADEHLCCIIRTRKSTPAWKPSASGWRSG